MSSDERIQIADLEVKQTSPLHQKTLKDVGPEMEKMIILAIKKPSGEYQFFPNADYVFQAGDNLIAVSTKESYRLAQDKFVVS